MPLQIVRQDITKMAVDAIVNTTNAEMVGYSGVDQAVHETAGPDLDWECAGLVPLGLGCAKITNGYRLPCRYVIHTNGPVWMGGSAGEVAILKACYMECLKMAVAHGCETVAFPLISSGTYGFPKDQVLKIAVQVITGFLMEQELTVYLCVFDRSSYEFSRKLFAEIREFIDDDYVTARVQEDIAPVLELERQWLPRKMMRPICGETAAPSSAPQSQQKHQQTPSLQEYMQAMDKSFAHKLFDWIDARGMTDVECYKKANVDKKTFSKIKCNADTYKPSKQTAVAFAIALRLNLEETQDLLASAGLTLSMSFPFDKIIRYFIQREIYDIFEINEALFEFDQVLLGC